MDNNYDYQLVIMQALIGANKQDTDEKIYKLYSELNDIKSGITEIKTMLNQMMVQIQNSSPKVWTF